MSTVSALTNCRAACLMVISGTGFRLTTGLGCMKLNICWRSCGRSLRNQDRAQSTCLNFNHRQTDYAHPHRPPLRHRNPPHCCHAGGACCVIISLLEVKLVTVPAWHPPLFVTVNFVSSFFLGRSRAFMCMLHTRTAKRSSG